MTEILRMTIGGECRPGVATFSSLDPYLGKAWVDVPEAAESDVDGAVAAARQALTSPAWGGATGPERAALLHLVADVLDANADELALLETRDNGKVIRETTAQIRSCGGWYRYFAGLSDKINGTLPDTGRKNYLGYVVSEPVGVVGAILPWNSPILLLTFKLAPALAAGCCVVAKPSEHAPASILRFAELLLEAGLPPGVFNVVSGSGSAVGEWLVAHPGVDKVAFTGSTTVGRQVAAKAGERLIPSSLELGGKSANIVFADADIEAAVNGIIAGIFAASGQTCVAGSRALIARELYDDVLARVVARASTIRMGDPKSWTTDVGPICFPGHLTRIDSMVRKAVRDGAAVVAGGEREAADSQFYPATVLTDVAMTSMMWHEEVFGPVLAVMPFDTEGEAITLANDSKYGLAAGVWTNDLRRAVRVSAALQVGTVWVNSYRTLTFAMPFEGRGQSGFGQENGIEAVGQFLRRKSVWIETEGSSRDPFVVG
jgi:(Z)-2-((N-methylformamido)methylene)-5-hydroxybutyrolactone dehydrogenase